MMILSTSDWHLRGKDLEDSRRALAWIAQIAQQEQIDVLLHAGDFFNSPNVGDRDAPTGAIYAVANDWISQMEDCNVKLFVIPGQHDFSGPGSADALHGLALRGHNVSRRNCSLWLRAAPPSLFVTASPWCYDPRGFDAYWRDELVTTDTGRREHETPDELAAHKTPSVFMAHVQAVGSRMAEGVACPARPGQWQIAQWRLDWIAAYVDRVVLGDFHRRQDLTNGKGGYVGALRQLSFSDENNPAGVELWDTETGEVRWIENIGSPRYYTEIAHPDEQAIVQAKARAIARGSREGTDYFRIQFDGRPTDLMGRQLETEGVRVEAIVEREERHARVDLPEGVAARPRELIRLWADTQTPVWDGERVARAEEQFDNLEGLANGG
uniref:Putative calcineurin-like phosphoesterase n=2 Tax=viral metagenome TaxID=1070528 RepID=A0A6M3K575_9ZZZZ